MHHRKSESGRGRSRKTTTREALEAGCRTALAQKSTPSNSLGKVSACAKTKSLSRSLSACLQAAAWLWVDCTFIPMHRCPPDSARAHAPRLDSCKCPDTCHASFAGDFASGNAGRLWPFGQIFQTGAISGQVSTILALPSQDSSVRALSYARVISGGRSCPALSRVHTYDLRQMLSNQEAVVVVFKFRSDYFTSRPGTWFLTSHVSVVGS